MGSETLPTTNYVLSRQPLSVRLKYYFLKQSKRLLVPLLLFLANCIDDINRNLCSTEEKLRRQSW
ncbi:hypothetical protein HY468_02655 [Candidatus Roizmanbacteria bacterium]|nr:hypothetical protein [Candidatus Roizmanbacteria bacterium]